ncbi:hypothetical protein NHX12_028534, partial [Muraenolepis orangiensis]
QSEPAAFVGRRGKTAPRNEEGGGVELVVEGGVEVVEGEVVEVVLVVEGGVELVVEVVVEVVVVEVVEVVLVVEVVEVEVVL